MCNEILLNQGWLFHKEEITVSKLLNKGPIYTQLKQFLKRMVK